MARIVKYLVPFSEMEVVAAFRRLPEIAKTRELALVVTHRGFDLERTRKRPPYEEAEFAPQQLRVSMTAGARGTLVTARTITRPKWIRIAAAVAIDVALWGGGGLIAGVVSVADIRERRRRERSELLNLLARSLAQHELGRSEAPYRAPTSRVSGPASVVRIGRGSR